MSPFLTTNDVAVDLRNLPIDYVTEMFYELAYDVDHYNGNNSYNGGCPICHEGHSWGKKKRCWWLPEKGIVHCFNCGETWNPLNFIKQAGGFSTKDIVEQIRNGEFGFVNLDRKVVELELSEEMKNLLSFKNGNLPENAIDLSNDNQMSFYSDNSAVLKALRYIKDRRLDTAVNKPKTFFISLDDHTHRNRLVFPFYDESGKVVFYQSRAIGANIDGYKEDIRYLGKVGAEKSVFNIDRIEPSLNEIFVFEGPIDSCFMRNGVAIAGISKGGKNFTDLQEEQLSLLSAFHDIVWMLDNQWVDETSLEKSKKLLAEGERVFIWPKKLKAYKDFNELCVRHGLDEVPLSFVRSCVFSGEEGLMRLMETEVAKKPVEDVKAEEDMCEVINSIAL